MSLDINVLAFLRKRERYERLAKAIQPRALDTRTQIVLQDYGRYFREYEDVQEVEAASFMLMFKSIHPETKDESMAVYTELFKRVCAEQLDPGIEKGLLKQLASATAAYDIADLLVKYNSGEEIDLRTEVQAVVEEFDTTTARAKKEYVVINNIEDLLVEDQHDDGYHWRLPCLNTSMRPLRVGDFGIVAARPDVGKGSFLASELTHMAPQVFKKYNGQRRILYLNNESLGGRVYKRLYQAASGATIEELVSRNQAGTLRSDYAKAVGSDLPRGQEIIEVVDVHGLSNVHIEDIIAQRQPSIVVYDMIDNIAWAGAAANNGSRTDQLLEAMYSWARIMCVKYDCIGIAASQVSAGGDGLQYPTLPMLKDSQTGKQGTADFIITIGAVNDPMLASSRFIGCTKNKLVRSNGRKSPMQEVIFDGNRCTWTEPD